MLIISLFYAMIVQGFFFGKKDSKDESDDGENSSVEGAEGEEAHA